LADWLKLNGFQYNIIECQSEAARGCLPPGANVSVAAPTNQIGNQYSYGYNDDVGVECHEHYAKLGV